MNEDWFTIAEEFEEKSARQRGGRKGGKKKKKKGGPLTESQKKDLKKRNERLTIERVKNERVPALKTQLGESQITKILPEDLETNPAAENYFYWVLENVKADSTDLKNWGTSFEDDIIFEPHHSSGPGGQRLNKVQTAVRAKHTVSGIRVDIQTERAQGANKREAIKLLRERVEEHISLWREIVSDLSLDTSDTEALIAVFKGEIKDDIFPKDSEGV